MAITMTGPITGAAVTGLTSPTYTLTAQQQLTLNSKTSYVSSLGGTQTGVNAHSLTLPFTVTFKWPSLAKTIATAMWNSVLGQYTRIPENAYQILIRKGVAITTPSGTQNVICERRINDRIICGAESSAELKAFNSFSAGFLSTNADGLTTTQATGVA